MKEQPRAVLIFGGAGFIGSNLAYQLLTRTEARVHIFDNLSRAGVHHNLDWLRKTAGKSGRLQVTLEDIRNTKPVVKAVAQASEIYHFAAQVAVTTSVTNPRLDFEVNLGGTFNVLDAARGCGHKPFILFTSTNKVYGKLSLTGGEVGKKRLLYQDYPGTSESQPLDFHSPYGCSKGGADQYVRDFSRVYELPSVVFRMSCIAGPRQFGTEDQGWVAHFVYSALQRQPIVIYGDGRQVRDVLCIYDLLRAFEGARLHRKVTGGQIYNVGGGMRSTVSLLELIDLIGELTGYRLEYVLDECRVGDQPVYVTNYAKLTRDTGWKPEIGVRQTLELLCDFWEENHDLVAQCPSTPAEAFDFASEATGRAA
jgi:CDP-paratose 2-epimerase